MYVCADAQDHTKIISNSPRNQPVWHIVIIASCEHQDPHYANDEHSIPNI